MKCYICLDVICRGQLVHFTCFGSTYWRLGSSRRHRKWTIKSRRSRSGRWSEDSDVSNIVVVIGSWYNQMLTLVGIIYSTSFMHQYIVMMLHVVIKYAVVLLYCQYVRYFSWKKKLLPFHRKFFYHRRYHFKCFWEWPDSKCFCWRRHASHCCRTRCRCRFDKESYRAASLQTSSTSFHLCSSVLHVRHTHTRCTRLVVPCWLSSPVIWPEGNCGGIVLNCH